MKKLDEKNIIVKLLASLHQQDAKLINIKGVGEIYSGMSSYKTRRLAKTICKNAISNKLTNSK